MLVYWDLADLEHNAMPSLTPPAEFQDISSENHAAAEVEERMPCVVEWN